VSLTEAEHVFASVNETALNDLITAVCTERPRLLAYGSPAFTPVTTVFETRMDPIPFPGIAGGIEWRIAFSVPHIDLFKQTDPLPPQLTLPAGGFSIHLAVELCLACGRIKIDVGQTHGDDKGDGRHPLREVTCCKLEIFVIGHLVSTVTTTGEKAIGFAVDAVEIVDITPDELESVLECLLSMILQAVLAEIRIPLRALRVGAFELTVSVGPLIEDDQIKARGSF
jgi:hypothetical protein